jgi:response regulator RpfG family c-di-GMP phosphodiesterase
MSLMEASGGGSSPESVALGEALTLFGDVSAFAAGAPSGEGERIAALAAGIAQQAGLSVSDCHALYFAARLRLAGALGNRAFAKGEHLPERAARMERWDIPTEGARLCRRIGVLPKDTADIVRWQAECWDGTGYPDQLRWAGIPKPAQLLHVAVAYVTASDPQEAFTEITSQSGRAYSPEAAGAFTRWFHLNAGEIDAMEVPLEALHGSAFAPADAFALLAERIDAHNATPGRANRLAAHATGIARSMNLPVGDIEALNFAALLSGAGELREREIESAQFGALARLGIELRARNAATAADLLGACPQLHRASEIVRARAEWYDGTGAPRHLRHEAIPVAARILGAVIAYDALEEDHRTRITEDRMLPVSRIDKAAGTQFDPAVLRALAETVKARA